MPTSLQLVPGEATQRLEEARRKIAFRPTRGFLHFTPVARLALRAAAQLS